MASEFPSGLFFTNPESGYDVHMHNPAAGQVFRPYALVVLDRTTNTISEIADSSLILGIAMSAAVDANSPYGFVDPDTYLSKVPVLVLTSHYSIGLACAGTLVETLEGAVVDLVKSASGNWKADLDGGAGTAFYIRRADVSRQIAHGYFVPDVLQNAAVAA